MVAPDAFLGEKRPARFLGRYTNVKNNDAGDSECVITIPILLVQPFHNWAIDNLMRITERSAIQAG